MSNETDIATLKSRVTALESLVVELLEAIARIDPDEVDRLNPGTSGYRIRYGGTKEALAAGSARRRRQWLLEAAYGAVPTE